jgi:FlaA1/EpsC-like NDP-sugar epimerase
MKVLVTGGAGFIGSYLVPRLLEEGMEVVVLDLASEPGTLAAVRDRITYVRGDLGSSADLYRVMLTHRPEGVFHLGAILAGPCEENPVLGFKVNFLSTQTLLDASLAMKVKRFFMVSSISVFGRDVKEPVADQAMKNPETISGTAASTLWIQGLFGSRGSSVPVERRASRLSIRLSSWMPWLRVNLSTFLIPMKEETGCTLGMRSRRFLPFGGRRSRNRESTM